MTGRPAPSAAAVPQPPRDQEQPARPLRDQAASGRSPENQAASEHPPPHGPARAQLLSKAAGSWPVGRMVATGIAVMALFSVAAIAIGAIALTDLNNARNRVVQTLDPAAYQASQLEASLLNQETGVRGYALSAQQSFLSPYLTGRADERRALAGLRPRLAGLPAAQRDLRQAISKVNDWRAGYAAPTIQQVKSTGKALVTTNIQRGKADFDGLRAALSRLQTHLAGQRRASVQSLHRAATALVAACIGIAAGLLLVVILLTLGVRNAAIRPLSRLAADARQITDGDLEHELTQSGPREVRELSADMSSMRERVLRDLSAVREANTALEARTKDLQRSNAELEQFAYVASHDLQEPLRKVASFCQLLQRRYSGQLDEKADQYIEYAVDGAKRMQMLINDLLAFSRVGRVEQPRVLTPVADLLGQARANLASAIRKVHARIEAGELPTVLAEPTLLTTVFQNLLSNALKFRGEQAPVVTVSARRDGEFWLFSVQDNGIGIAPGYADRIFVIFQRLHDRSTYPGTGIGLAMCRKIIEYHGGRIWLDTSVVQGSRFCFTLPAVPEGAEAGDGESEAPEAAAETSGEPGAAEMTKPPDKPDIPDQADSTDLSGDDDDD
jgi:signal transduction histidine kinase